MSLNHQLLTVYASAVALVSPVQSSFPDYCENVTISIQNLDSVNYVYFGNSGISSVSYGFRLSPNQAFSIDLGVADQLFATSSDTSSQVAITRLYWQ